MAAGGSRDRPNTKIVRLQDVPLCHHTASSSSRSSSSCDLCEQFCDMLNTKESRAGTTEIIMFRIADDGYKNADRAQRSGYTERSIDTSSLLKENRRLLTGARRISVGTNTVKSTIGNPNGVICIQQQEQFNEYVPQTRLTVRVFKDMGTVTCLCDTHDNVQSPPISRYTQTEYDSSKTERTVLTENATTETEAGHSESNSRIDAVTLSTDIKQLINKFAEIFGDSTTESSEPTVVRTAAKKSAGKKKQKSKSYVTEEQYDENDNYLSSSDDASEELPTIVASSQYRDFQSRQSKPLLSAKLSRKQMESDREAARRRRHINQIREWDTSEAAEDVLVDRKRHSCGGCATVQHASMDTCLDDSSRTDVRPCNCIERPPHMRCVTVQRSPGEVPQLPVHVIHSTYPCLDRKAGHPPPMFKEQLTAAVDVVDLCPEKKHDSKCWSNGVSQQLSKQSQRGSECWNAPKSITSRGGTPVSYHSEKQSVQSITKMQPSAKTSAASSNKSQSGSILTLEQTRASMPRNQEVSSVPSVPRDQMSDRYLESQKPTSDYDVRSTREENEFSFEEPSSPQGSNQVTYGGKVSFPEEEDQSSYDYKTPSQGDDFVSYGGKTPLKDNNMISFSEKPTLESDHASYTRRSQQQDDDEVSFVERQLSRDMSNVSYGSKSPQQESSHVSFVGGPAQPYVDHVSYGGTSTGLELVPVSRELMSPIASGSVEVSPQRHLSEYPCESPRQYDSDVSDGEQTPIQDHNQATYGRNTPEPQANEPPRETTQTTREHHKHRDPCYELKKLDPEMYEQCVELTTGGLEVDESLSELDEMQPSAEGSAAEMNTTKRKSHVTKKTSMLTKSAKSKKSTVRSKKDTTVHSKHVTETRYNTRPQKASAEFNTTYNNALPTREMAKRRLHNNGKSKCIRGVIRMAELTEDASEN